MLTIYKASAGSGKTYQLAVEYISLLVLRPDDYRRILAVTFTNKATEEMKTRIVNQLYAISRSLPSGDAMLRSVRQKLVMHVGQSQVDGCYGDSEIRRRAGKALSLILHNYSFFRVQTIDAFFMGVLRNLAHELGLNANLRVGLNDVEVESKAVDHLIERLQKGQGGRKNELDWIIEFIMTKIADNKSWKVIDLLKQFGKHIFDDIYKECVATNHKAFDIDYPTYIRELCKVRDEATAAAREKMRLLLKKIEDDGRYTTDDHYQGKSRGVLAYIHKVADGTQEMGKETSAVARKCMNDAAEWVAKKHKTYDEMLTFVQQELITDFREAEQEWQEQGRRYLSACLTMANLDKLRLLKSIADKVREQNSYMNRFQLSDTQTLLRRFIQDETDAPFVYEKTGATLRHIMIDEFQDTSGMQWQNFKVLLDDCNANAVSHNIIVGDVKQSIYRWRGGDWKLLNDMTLPQPSAHHEAMRVEVMDKNYRSLWGVVHFNNWFFHGAAQQEAALLEQDEAAKEAKAGDDLRHAYAQSEQKAVRKAQGSVRVELLKGGGDITERMLQRVGHHVQQLLKQGVSQHDIAILVRNNSHPHAVADYFSRTDDLKNVTLVSDQAFLLDTSLAVNTIISAMALLQHPDDMVLRAQLVKYYQRYILGNEDMTDSRLFVDNDPLSLLPQRYAPAVTNEREVTNDAQRAKECRRQREAVLSLPMMELIDHLHECFELHRITGEDAYLCAFRDNVAEYLQDHVADIGALLDYWEETLHEKSIQSDATDGIRILTIHKSKGLQYPYVIVPFADWKMEHTSDTLWCATDGLAEPFCRLPLVPINYSRKMLRSVYAPHYEEEHRQNVVDNLNMLYVALTRAEKGLVVIGKWTENDKGEVSMSTRSGLLTQWMIQCAGKQKKRATEQAEPRWTEPEKWRKCFDVNDANEINSFTFGTPAVDHEAMMRPPTQEMAATAQNERPTVGQEMRPATLEMAATAQNEQPTVGQCLNPFDVKATDIPVTFRTAGKCASFKCSNDSRRFISSDDDSVTDDYISLGNVVHEVLSHITTLSDGDATREVDALLDEMETQGVIDVAENRQRVRQMILSGLRKPQVNGWFSGNWQLFNECTILERDTDGVVHEHRPDRVMVRDGQAVVVDFKTGSPFAKHQEQVRRYMRLLRQMGYADVSGYLWYTASGQVEHIEN